MEAHWDEFSQTVIAPARTNTSFLQSLSRSLGLSFSRSDASTVYDLQLPSPTHSHNRRAQIETTSLSSFPFSDSPIPNILHHRSLQTKKPKSSQPTPATTQVFRTLAFPSYSPPLPTFSVPCAVHSPSSSHFLISILLLISLRASLTPGMFGRLASTWAFLSLSLLCFRLYSFLNLSLICFLHHGFNAPLCLLLQGLKPLQRTRKTEATSKVETTRDGSLSTDIKA
ncbi:unnamed protein product [Prunus armeniaca]|uniref:Uncharacterized protein n=1 Tax=Prunus armeniaca TaxID=36596 RepID=A0A6J5XE72_PRUAR|nr:unnamed protein product [Prunus armeniaca]